MPTVLLQQGVSFQTLEDESLLDAALTCSLSGTSQLRQTSGPVFQEGITVLAQAFSAAKRPVIFLGGLLSRKVAWELRSVFARAKVTVITATYAVDRIPGDDPLNACKLVSSVRHRSADGLLAQADVVMGVAMQLDSQQTGFYFQAYEGNTDIFHIYPDQEDLNKGHPVLTGAMTAVPVEFLPELLPELDAELLSEVGKYLPS